MGGALFCKTQKLDQDKSGHCHAYRLSVKQEVSPLKGQVSISLASGGGKDLGRSSSFIPCEPILEDRPRAE